MIKRITTLGWLLMASLTFVGCADESSDPGAPTEMAAMSQEEAQAFAGSEFIVVKASEAGVEFKETNEDPIEGDEGTVAAAEAEGFQGFSEVVDGEGNSSESFFYGHNTSGYQPSHSNYNSTYYACQPKVVKKGYVTAYQYVGRSYHKPSNSYYQRYRRFATYYWPGKQSYYNKTYFTDYHQPTYQRYEKKASYQPAQYGYTPVKSYGYEAPSKVYKWKDSYSNDAYRTQYSEPTSYQGYNEPSSQSYSNSSSY